MRVYHFIKAKYGLQDLRKRRLKIARIMELNDPFEFIGIDSPDAELRQALEAISRILCGKGGERR